MRNPGMPTLDEDLILLRDSINEHGATEADPGDAFRAALRRRQALLRRTAGRHGWKVSANIQDPLPLSTVRQVASYLLPD